MTDFRPDSAFEAGSVAAGEWGLCHVRLQDDARFPWLILIPRVEDAVELDDLDARQRATLMEETVRAGELVRALGRLAGRSIDKLNVGAIGNVTAQLHVHVVGRRREDDLWPDPVWGRGPAQAYADEARAVALARIAEG